MTPLRIAHVDADSHFSGGEMQLFLLVDGLARRGHRNVLFCRPRSGVREEAQLCGVETRCVAMRGDVDASSVLALARAFRYGGFDLAHLHTGRATWLGGLAAWMGGLPAITTRRMDRPVKRNWRTRLIYTRLVQRAVAISPAVARCLAGGGVPAERTAVIWDAVDPERLRPTASPSATRAVLGAAASDRVLLITAALICRKALDVLLDALALLAAGGLRPILWVAGDGPQRALCEAQARRLALGERVRFLGFRRDVPDLMAACDVLVVPSRREGLGVVALEAMAAGKPVVGSAVGGLCEAVVDGRTGLLVPPGDAAALARALKRILSAGDLRRRLGAAGPARLAEGFLADHMVAAYENLYRDVLSGWRESTAVCRAVAPGR